MGSEKSHSSGGPPPSITLHVSHQRDQRNNESLVFAAVPPDIEQTEGIVIGEPIYHSIESQQVRLAIDDVRNQVITLAVKATRSEPREGVGVETVAQRLSEVVLPAQGFSSILAPGLHPRFFSLHDIAEDVPWECLEEHCGYCEKNDCQFFGRMSRLPPGQADQPRFCPGCGQALAKAGGKLVLERRISHLVQGGPRNPWEGGREFVLIVDPRCDVYLRYLAQPQPGERQHTAEEVERAQECKLRENMLVKLLKGAGYEPTVVRGPHATARDVLTAISKPGVVGVYYFGHGEFPKDQDQGRLLLSNGEVLTANHIKAHGTTARFVFLNACWGAAASTDWGLGRKSNSVGNAFAYGNRVVLAPLWPVYCIQAAQAAVTFFQAAVAGQSLMDATIQMRRVSYEAYQSGQPDISWMAYRYFGPCDRRLPKAGAIAPVAPANLSQPLPIRVFAQDQKLDADLFDFPVESILFRAAKRKVFQKRPVVNSCDLLAGLIRRGGLFRYALGKLNLAPDKLYDLIIDFEDPHAPPAEEAASKAEMVEEPEIDPSDKEALARKFKAFLQRFIVRQQTDFDERVLEVFRAADLEAQKQPRERAKLITERDVIVELLKTRPWPAVPRLPEPSEIAKVLEAIEREGVVDQNGCVNLDALEPEARRIVDTAHELSQQRGIRPIPNRVMLAAFLVNPQGAAAKLFKQQLRKGTPEAVKDILVASTKGSGAETFLLTPEVCDRIVLPMLRQAQKLAGEGKKVSESLLFAAMCQVAALELKHLMGKGFGIDLDALGNIALKWAQGQPGLMLIHPEKWTTTRIPWIESGLSSGDGKSNRHAGNGSPPSRSPTLSSDVWREEQFEPQAWQILISAGRWAIWEKGCLVQLSHLFAALVGDQVPSLVAALRQAGKSPDRYRHRVLQKFPTSPVLLADVAVSQSVQQILLQAQGRAAARKAPQIECLDLARSFFGAADNPIVPLVAQDGIRLPPDVV